MMDLNSIPVTMKAPDSNNNVAIIRIGQNEGNN